MASLTVRQLDDKLKRLLRLRAARHGRSMEDEVRVILRSVIGVVEQVDLGTAIHKRFSRVGGVDLESLPRTPAVEKAVGSTRILLIIGGGIAAYKSLDLIRRLQDRGVRVRCILT